MTHFGLSYVDRAGEAAMLLQEAVLIADNASMLELLLELSEVQVVI